MMAHSCGLTSLRSGRRRAKEDGVHQRRFAHAARGQEGACAGSEVDVSLGRACRAEERRGSAQAHLLTVPPGIRAPPQGRPSSRGPGSSGGFRRGPPTGRLAPDSVDSASATAPAEVFLGTSRSAPALRRPSWLPRRHRRGRTAMGRIAGHPLPPRCRSVTHRERTPTSRMARSAHLSCPGRE
jgi:hypothetical protein